jgi:hypothetical protein
MITAEIFLIESRIAGLNANDIMIEFTKLHVEKALKRASENAKIRITRYNFFYASFYVY